MDKYTFSKRNPVHVCTSTFKMLFIRANYVKKENSIDSPILLVYLGAASCGALNEFLIHM